MRPHGTELLSRDQTHSLKAVCILAVMMHNFLHICGFALENEFQFYADRAAAMWQHVLHPGLDTPLHFISFCGHHALIGFVFVSGYGLVKKYEHGATPFSHGRFISRHYAKLLRLAFLPMLTAFAVYRLLRGVTPLSPLDRVLEFLLLGNLKLYPSIYPYVYWYLGMALQLYLLYACLRRPAGDYPRWHLTLLASLVLGCGTAQMACSPTGVYIHYLRLNLAGYVGPFVAGMVSARHLDSLTLRRSAWAALCLGGAAVSCLSMANYHAWLWNWVPTTVFLVSLVKAFGPSQWKPLVWLGSVSAAVYVAHPIVREVAIALSPSHVKLALLAYMAASVALAAGYARLLKWLPRL